jgi:uncharacterized lipoprotein
MRSTKTAALLLVLLGLVLGGCAYSPQTVTVNPALKPSGQSTGGNRPVTLTVADERANKVLGTRGGIYDKTSTITIGNDMPDAIARAARGYLAAQGFIVGVPDAPSSLHIAVDTLSYDRESVAAGEKIGVYAVMRAELRQGRETYRGRYETRNEHRTAGKASPRRNEELVNELISDTLARVFADAELMRRLHEGAAAPAAGEAVPGYMPGALEPEQDSRGLTWEPIKE